MNTSSLSKTEINKDVYASRIVTLPESTPVLEATHLQNDLQRADINPWVWIVNSSLAVANMRQPLLRKRALSEQEQIDNVRDHLSKRNADGSMQAEEPMGVEKLNSLCAMRES